MLAQLFLCRVLQHRAQRIQHLLHRQLRRRARVIVADRNIGGLARLDRQADADQARAHRVQRIGFGIEADQIGLLQALDPGLQLLAGQHGLVFTWRGQRRIQRASSGGLGAATGEAGGGTAQARGSFAGHRGRRQWRTQLLQRLGEAIARVQLGQHRYVLLTQGKRGRAGVQLHVGADGHQLAVQRQPLQRGAQVLADLALHGRRGCHHAVQVLVLGQPLGGGLRPAFLHARHVVDGVAHQRQQVDDLVGAHAELVHHRRIRIHAAAGHGVDQFDARAHQLGEILVAGGNGHLQVLRQALQRQRADHIVGLHAGNAQDADAQRLDDAAHRFDLAAQLIGHRRAVGLVLLVQVVAEGLAGRIDHERHVGRALLQRRTQHVDHAEQRAGGFTLCIGQGRQRVERAVQVTGPVDQD